MSNNITKLLKTIRSIRHSGKISKPKVDADLRGDDGSSGFFDGYKVKYKIISIPSQMKYVFIDNENTLHVYNCQLDEASSHIFQQINYRAQLCLEKDELFRARSLIGYALYNSHLAGNSQAILNAENEISSIILANAKVNKAMLSIIFSVVIVVFITSAPNWYSLLNQYFDLASGSVMGMLGSVLASLMDIDRLRIDKRTPTKSLIAMDSASRCIIGLGSGFVTICILKSGFISSGEHLNPYGIAVMAFISGFSEKWFPSLVGKISGMNDDYDRKMANNASNKYSTNLQSPSATMNKSAQQLDTSETMT